jgi:hypothetical protein
MSSNSEYKYLSDSISFDSEGRTYPIADADLIDVLSKSDFAKPEKRPFLMACQTPEGGQL